MKPCIRKWSKVAQPTIAIPSEYMIAKMMKEGLVEKLDHSQIKGLENIGSGSLDQPSIQEISTDSYFWGTLLSTMKNGW